jgi:hypothetical protein
MALVGSVSVGFKGDTRGLDKAAEQALRQLDHVTKQVHGMKKALQEAFSLKSATGGGGALAGLSGLMGLVKGGAVLALVNGMKDAALQGDKLAASGRTLNTIFGQASGGVKGTIEQLASGLGLARVETSQLAVQIGANLTNAGIEAGAAAEKTSMLLKRAADMATATGYSASDAVTAIASALRGEYDPIEKFGVGIKQAAVEQLLLAKGAEKVNGQFDQQSKTLATLELLMNQTNKFTGASSETAETASGAFARLTASFEKLISTLGTFLAPVVKFVSDLLNGLVSTLQMVVEGWQKLQYAIYQLAGGTDSFKKFTNVEDGKAAAKVEGVITQEKLKQLEAADKAKKAQADMADDAQKAKVKELGDALKSRASLKEQIAKTTLEKQFGANDDVFKLLKLKGQFGEGNIMDLARQLDAANGMASQADLAAASTKRAGLASAGSREAFSLEMAARTGSGNGGVEKNTAKTADTLAKMLEWMKGNPEQAAAVGF